MEVAVEVALLSARLMGSPEGFGSGGVVVGEVRWGTEGACSSGGRKDDILAATVSASSYWRKIPDAEHCVEASQPSSLLCGDVSNDHSPGDMNSHPPTLDKDLKRLVQKPGKIERKISGCTKRSTMVQMESSKSKPGSHYLSGISPDLVASASASCKTSEKNQLIKQRNSSASKRGDKRNCKVKHKNRCDSFSPKNGLVGFSSVAGGNNFFGMYGLKPDVFDITKYVNELSLNELLCGSYTFPCIADDKGKKVASSNNDLLQSVRNACSILQARKVLQAQNCAQIDNSCIRMVSNGLVSVNSAVGQTDSEKGDSRTAVLPSSHQVQESHDKVKMSSLADSPPYTPKDILERLALPPPRDLDLLLSDAIKTTSSSKSSADSRLGKPVALRTGLPPFPWSHSFSGHGKLGSDAGKLSASRTTCQGRWVKVKNSFARQKDSADLLADFESLAFNPSLVPANLVSEHQENKFGPIERVLSTSGACSISKVPADEYSPTHAAAQTLLDMAARSKENPSAVENNLLKKPPQMTMKASNSKAIKRSKLFDAPISRIRATNSLKVGDYGFSSKKLRLSTDVTNAYIGYTDPTAKGKSNQSSLLSVKSPPRKLLRDSNASIDSYGINPVKKPCVVKTPRNGDRLGSSTKQKLWKPSQ